MKRLSDVKRIGYGAMRLTGPHIMGPPADPDEARRVLRRAVELGVDHIDTSDYYGPYVVNDLIREALAPYPPELVLVTKVGARRTESGGWLPVVRARRHQAGGARQPRAPRRGAARRREPAPDGRLRGLDGRAVDGARRPAGQGLVADLGLSNVTPAEVEERSRSLRSPASRTPTTSPTATTTTSSTSCAEQGIFYVPFFPLGGFSPLRSAAVDGVAAKHGATSMQVALAWLLQRSPNILLIPGTSSVAHLEENLAAGRLKLDDEDLDVLDKLH